MKVWGSSTEQLEHLCSEGNNRFYLLHMAGFANNAIDELQEAVYETFTTFCSFGAGQRGESLMDSVSLCNCLSFVGGGVEVLRESLWYALIDSHPYRRKTRAGAPHEAL